MTMGDLTTYDAGRSYKVSFYRDFPVDRQEKFVSDLQHWLMSVD